MMKFRFGGRVYDFEMLLESQQDGLMQEWRNAGPVECLCQGEQHTRNPLLHVKLINDSLFFANNPSNSKNDVRHDFKCRYNRQGYRSLLEGQGIHIDDDEIRVNLDVDPPRLAAAAADQNSKQPVKAKFTDPEVRKKSEKLERKVRLPLLLFTMLQEYKVTEFRPNGQRNIAKRLYKIAQIIKVNDMPLIDILYVAEKEGKWPRNKHQLIIGWGRRSAQTIEHPTNPKFVRVPLYSVDDPSHFVTEQTVLKSVFNKCTSEVPEVNGGYYIMFRGPAYKGDKNTWDRQIYFIPAEEEKTRIPVGSASEEKVIKHLADACRHFERPLIGNVTELFLDRAPDIVIHDTDPKTIVSVIGKGDGTIADRQKKGEGYTSKGYSYVEWDGESPIPF